MIEIYQFKVGSFDCYAINDGSTKGKSDMLFANAPNNELAQALERYGEQPEVIPSTWTCLLVRTESQIVLIDTGIGEEAGPQGGNLLPALNEVGIAPEDIDIVILTHIHGDHILGAVQKNGNLTFPKAQYIMGKEEWEFWTSETSLQTAPQWAANTAKRVLPHLKEKIRPLENEAVVTPGIRILSAPGHTFGHIVVEIESKGEYFYYLADTVLHPIHLEYPHWYAGVDQFPEQAIQTRLRFCDMAAKKGSLVLAFHFHPFPSLGYIIPEGSSWRWKPISV